MSRNKGKRIEYLVRDYLRSVGYKDAVRVPLSGASEGFKGDVVYTDDNGDKITIEVKARKSGFKTIYDKFINKIVHHPIYRFIIVAKASLDDQFTTETAPLTKREIKIFETLYKLKAGADYLVIKDNGKPLVFIKFVKDWEDEIARN